MENPLEDAPIAHRPFINFTVGMMPSEHIRAFGKRVRNLRKEQGLSQQTLADRANLKRPYLARIENGRCLPTMNGHVKLACALDIELSDFVYETWSRIIYSVNQ